MLSATAPEIRGATRVRSPSFINLNALSDMCKGGKVADTIITFGAIDIVLGEVDR